MITVAEIMSTDVKTLGPDAHLNAVHLLMQQQKFRHIPIVDDSGVLIGVVSLTDVMEATLPFDLVEADDSGRTELANTNLMTARDMMRSVVQTTTPQTSARQAARVMEKLKIGCLPVVEGGKLRGIVTDSDFLAVAINLMEQIDATEESFDE